MNARIIVCGGRDFDNRELCFKYLEKLVSMYENPEIVSGHAKGADTFGEEYAAMHELPVKIFKPDWKKYGRAAGPIRNKEMLTYAVEENPVVIAFWNGESKGTKNMIEQAKKANAKVHVVAV